MKYYGGDNDPDDNNPDLLMMSVADKIAALINKLDENIDKLNSIVDNQIAALPSGPETDTFKAEIAALEETESSSRRGSTTAALSRSGSTSSTVNVPLDNAGGPSGSRRLSDASSGTGISSRIAAADTQSTKSTKSVNSTTADQIGGASGDPEWKIKFAIKNAPIVLQNRLEAIYNDCQNIISEIIPYKDDDNNNYLHIIGMYNLRPRSMNAIKNADIENGTYQEHLNQKNNHGMLPTDYFERNEFNPITGRSIKGGATYLRYPTKF